MTPDPRNPKPGDRFCYTPDRPGTSHYTVTARYRDGYGIDTVEVLLHDGRTSAWMTKVIRDDVQAADEAVTA